MKNMFQKIIILQNDKLVYNLQTVQVNTIKESKRTSFFSKLTNLIKINLEYFIVCGGK